MTGSTVLCCPDCGIATLRSKGRRSDHDYDCRDCGECFDAADVLERERWGEGGIREDSLAAALDDADPEDVGTEADRDG